MTPILGAGLALTQREPTAFPSIVDHHLLGFVSALFASMAFGVLFMVFREPWNTEEMWARCKPSPLDFCVGLVGGIAASYARTRSHLSSALAGRRHRCCIGATHRHGGSADRIHGLGSITHRNAGHRSTALGLCKRSDHHVRCVVGFVDSWDEARFGCVNDSSMGFEIFCVPYPFHLNDSYLDPSAQVTC